jgi:ribosome-binding protein aMBF1 (putative translation factor)
MMLPTRFHTGVAMTSGLTMVRRESWVSRGVWQRRAAKRWSRRELAERSGVAVGTILNIEHGYCMPAVDTLEIVLRELGCELIIKEVE